jgi:hypothetical protein
VQSNRHKVEEMKNENGKRRECFCKQICFNFRIVTTGTEAKKTFSMESWDDFHFSSPFELTDRQTQIRHQPCNLIWKSHKLSIRFHGFASGTAVCLSCVLISIYVNEYKQCFANIAMDKHFSIWSCLRMGEETKERWINLEKINLKFL